MERRRTLVVGDVHGCADEVRDLLTKAGFRKGHDRLVFCGDLLDRGPDPHGVVALAREYGAVTVLGNHEEKHLRYREHALRAKADPKYVIPMRKPHPETHDALTEEDWAYLARCPVTYEIGRRTVVVHGGFSKDCPRWRPKKQSCRVRYVHTTSRKMAKSSDGFTQPGETVFWTERYLGTKNVIYGHHSYAKPTKRIRPNGVWTLGLDTGCVFGGSLTGYWVEQRAFVSVPARRRYYADISEPKDLPKVRPQPAYQPTKRYAWDWGSILSE
jgi:hypothetical protein